MRKFLSIFMVLAFLAGPVFAGNVQVQDWTHGHIISGTCTSNQTVTGTGNVEGKAMVANNDDCVYEFIYTVPSNATGLNFVPTIYASSGTSSATGCVTVDTAVAEGDAVVGNLNYGNAQVVSITGSSTANGVASGTGAGAALYDGSAGNCDSNCAGKQVHVRYRVGVGCTATGNPWRLYHSNHAFGE